MMVIATEGTIFLLLISSYFFLRAASHQWPPAGIELPDLKLSLPFSFVLWGSSIPIFWAERAIKRGRQTAFRAGVVISFLMGASFLLYTAKDFHDLHFGWQDNAYGSIFYVTVGLHALHVVVGLLMNLVVQFKAWLGKFDERHHTFPQVFFLYWHFVDGVCLFVFPC